MMKLKGRTANVTASLPDANDGERRHRVGLYLRFRRNRGVGERPFFEHRPIVKQQTAVLL
jgi:hypothetical protein